MLRVSLAVICSLCLCYAVAAPNPKRAKLTGLLGELRVLTEKTKMAEPLYYGRNSEENRALLKVFYTCLEKTAKLAAVYKRLPSDSVTVLEGGAVTMDCNLCFSPSHLDELPPMWTWSGEPLPDDDLTVVDKRTGRLRLFGARLEQAGLYVCRLGAAESAPILLTVVSTSFGLRLVRGPNAKRGTKAAEDKELVIGSTKLLLFSDWTPWGECSRCGEVGRHYRFGACALKLLEDNITFVSTKRPRMKFRSRRELSKNYVFSVKDLAKMYKTKFKKFINRVKSTTTKSTTTAKRTERITPRKTLDNTENISAEVLDLLEIFINGLPCSSRLLPPALRNNVNVLDRKNELMEGYCKPPCVDEVFEVKDSLGKTIERVNNSGGLFSALQGPPQLPPVPSRTSIFAPIGEPLVISCPGHLHHDVPYYWTVNRNSRLYPRVIADQSRGRVTMDYRQRLMFKEVEPEDSRLYVCWQVGSIAGVVRLVVFDPSTVGYNHHVMLFGVTVILGAFLYLSARIYLNKSKAAAA